MEKLYKISLLHGTSDKISMQHAKFSQNLHAKYGQNFSEGPLAIFLTTYTN